MSDVDADVVVVGGGIVGLATAWALATAGRRVVVLEAEDAVGLHQTGRNSGVVHAGLYYQPGSLKAKLAVEGREEMFSFAREHALAHERCGKLVVATHASEIAKLDELERRARANGLEGVLRLSPDDIRAREPEAAGVAGLWVPQTGVVDFAAVARRIASLLEERGHRVLRQRRVRALTPLADGIEVQCVQGGETLRARHLVNCAGVQSDRVARLAGLRPGARIVPFRGEYFDLRPERRGLVRGLIYPVPDPRFPFLGVHLTRRIDGTVEAGPNAVLALARHGRSRHSVSVRDVLSTALFPGFWRFAARHLGTGFAEWRRSGSPRRFARDLKRLVPAIEARDLAPGGFGVRAQALGSDGRLIDDFLLVDGPSSTHVLNAPSPAATASFAIGRFIAARVATRL